MIDQAKAVDALLAVYPYKDRRRAELTLARLIKEVNDAAIASGDFFFVASYGFHVQRVHYEEDGLDDVEVFICLYFDEEN